MGRRSARRALTALLVCATAGAQADGVDGSIGIVSDKVLRGISQTGGRAAVVTDLGYAIDRAWSASVEWAVPQSVSPLSHSLATLVLAHNWLLSDKLSAQATYGHYWYLGGARQRAYDYDELEASLDLQGRGYVSMTMSPNVAVAADARLRHAIAMSYEAGVRHRLVARWTVNGGIGYRALRITGDGGYSYGYGSVGVGNVVGPLQLDLAYIGTTSGVRRASPTAPSTNRWVASAMWPF